MTNIVDVSDALVKSYTYDAYGNTSSTGTFVNNFAYTGAVIDAETGLYYMNARYYDPETGRFISQDSYRGDGEVFWHLYLYCNGDPVNNTDPSGHKSVWDKINKYYYSYSDVMLGLSIVANSGSALYPISGLFLNYALSKKKTLLLRGQKENQFLLKNLITQATAKKLFNKYLKTGRRSDSVIGNYKGCGDLSYAIGQFRLFILSITKREGVLTGKFLLTYDFTEEYKQYTSNSSFIPKNLTWAYKNRGALLYNMGKAAGKLGIISNFILFADFTSYYYIKTDSLHIRSFYMEKDYTKRIILISVAVAIVIIVGPMLLLLPSGEFPDPDILELLNGYKERLNIYLPVREAEKYEDTHGGMTGDGDTMIILNLTEEEVALLNEDVVTNTHWSKFPLKENCISLYSIEGLLDPSIERLSEGYYCLFDKQTEQYNILNWKAYSFNFLFVEYDVTNRTLYLEEFDS